MSSPLLSSPRNASTGLSRRGVNTGPPLSLPSTLEDPTANWKGTPGPGPEPQQQNNGQGNFNANNSNFGGPVFSATGQGSPAPGSGPNYQGPPGSNTPQYTASPAPSGSSTPGPGPPQHVGNAGFPPPNNQPGPGQFQQSGQGQAPMSFGSPSGPSFGRPGKFLYILLRWTLYNLITF